MKHLRRLSFLLALLITLSCFMQINAFAEGDGGTVSADPGITSNNAIVAYCIDNQQYLYTNRMDETVEPSVVAKLVACMVVSDLLKERNADSDEVNVTITESVVSYTNNCYNSSATDRIFVDFRMPIMGFGADEIYTAKDLLSATLVAGANDAVIALACHFGEVFLGGDINTFVDKMNEKVSELGLKNTHFLNPTGLSEVGQKTTAADSAIITAAFYKYNELVTLANVETFLLNGRTTVRSKNFLKNNYYIDGYFNEDAIGIIAGQPNADGDYCLIAATQKDGLTYIFVIMDANGIVVDNKDGLVSYSLAENNAYEDAAKLIKWSRASFQFYVVASGDVPVDELRVNHGDVSDHIMVYPEGDIQQLIPGIDTIEIKQDPVAYNQDLVYYKKYNDVEHPTIDAPVEAGQVVGTVTYYYLTESGERVDISTVNAIVKEGSEVNQGEKLLSDIGNFLTGTFMKTVVFILIGIIVLYILVSIISGIIRKTQKRKQKNAKKNLPQKKDN